MTRAAFGAAPAVDGDGEVAAVGGELPLVGDDEVPLVGDDEVPLVGDDEVKAGAGASGLLVFDVCEELAP